MPEGAQWPFQNQRQARGVLRTSRWRPTGTPARFQKQRLHRHGEERKLRGMRNLVSGALLEKAASCPVL